MMTSIRTASAAHPGPAALQSTGSRSARSKSQRARRGPRFAGSYQLILALTGPITVRVGALGVQRFPPGYYVYTGSARGCLRRRLVWHLRRRNRVRWHIDALLRHPRVRVVAIRVARAAECAWHRATPGSEPVARLGASDCRNRCRSHLRFLGADPFRVGTFWVPIRNGV